MHIIKPESLTEFYAERLETTPPRELQQGIGHFNVFNLQDCVGPNALPIKYSRRDFYKITLIKGKNRYHYADRSLELDGAALIFFNPATPYTWELVGEEVSGYFCIFSTAFFSESTRNKLTDLPMYQQSGKPAYLLTPEQESYAAEIFQRMAADMASDYVFKFDLMRNYVAELTHFALKSNPSDPVYQHPDSKSRITAVFNELLERQFPIETPDQRFAMRSARDFADQLAIHVNYLNRAVKHATGKTTTHLIAERLLTEAKMLLKHTDWNVSEIAYALGFEEPAHFNNFFKKQTQFTPTAFRAA